jgi:hypothetical protein
VSAGKSARRAREHPAFWIGVCFDCGSGHPDNWQRFRPHEVPASARDSARSWMTEHACKAGHTDLLIACGRLENGAALHALPQMLLDGELRGRVLDSAAVFERALVRRDRLQGREMVTILLPSGHLIEAVSSVMDTVTAYAALAHNDLGD